MSHAGNNRLQVYLIKDEDNLCMREGVETGKRRLRPIVAQLNDRLDATPVIILRRLPRGPHMYDLAGP